MQTNRICVFTRLRLPKENLFRISKIKLRDGTFKVVGDAIGIKPGRGIYITPKKEILEMSLDKGILARALKLERQITPEEVSNIVKEFDIFCAERGI